MKFFPKIFSKLDGEKTNRPVVEQRPVKSGGLLSSLFNGRDSKLPEVTTENAHEIDTVYACWNVLSQDISSLPLSLMKRDGDSIRALRTNEHPVAELLENPNDVMTGVEWRAHMMVRLLAYGNAFDQVVRDRKGVPLEIYPLENKKTGLQFEKGELFYLYKTQLVQSGTAALRADSVLHNKGLSLDGILGLSPICAQKKALGLAVSAEDFGIEFFGNGAVMSGMLELPGTLNDEPYNRLKKSLNETYTGKGNRHKLLILEDGAKFSSVSVPANQAQFLETRKFQRSNVCGFYRVPAHMVNDLERATFSNIEEQGIMYVSNTLLPWCVSIEKRLAKTLLIPEERAEGFYFKHNLRGLMRGKFSEQMISFATAKQNGFMSANEVRAMLDMNPYEGGNLYTTNAATIPASGQQPQPTNGGNT